MQFLSNQQKPPGANVLTRPVFICGVFIYTYSQISYSFSIISQSE